MLRAQSLSDDTRCTEEVYRVHQSCFDTTKQVPFILRIRRKHNRSPSHDIIIRLKMLWIGMLLFLLGVGVEAQVPFLGTCPPVKTVENFEPARYMGKWFEAEKYFALFQFGGKCVTANYTLSENGSVRIRNSQISSITGVATSINGIGRLIGRSDDAKLTVVFPSLPLQVEAPYWVVDTDYDNWAVVWSCVDLSVFSVRYSWILTREQNPPVSVLEEAYQAVDRNKISRAYYLRTDQKNCPAS